MAELSTQDVLAGAEALSRLFLEAADSAVSVRSRDEGIAFLRVSKDLIAARSLTYAAFNIPAPHERGLFTHCFYSDRLIRHAVGARFGRAADAHTLAGDGVTMRLRTTMGEDAFLVADLGKPNSTDPRTADELRTLGGYFHAHICRINGCGFLHDALSARELDCLQWTAAGKTAWEASIILGVTERTVRFHLNMAREKLKCATTSQAVAKAVGSGLITA